MYQKKKKMFFHLMKSSKTKKYFSISRNVLFELEEKVFFHYNFVFQEKKTHFLH